MVDEAMASEPATVPLAEGVKTTPTEQLAPAARLAPQVFCVRLKGAVTASVSPAAATLLVLVIVAVCAGLDNPTLATANVICAGLTLIPDVACPVPLSAT